jgi:hypothetical protein
MNSSPIYRMRLHFPWTKVAKALAEARTATNIRTLYGAVTGPGLWLVGDEGVYLMPNTISKARNIIYARECDPSKLDFEIWWANKRRSFGGGDGVDFIALEDVDSVAAEFLEKQSKKPRFLCIDISEEHFTIGVL